VTRPAVDVVVPFGGGVLGDVLRWAGALARRDGDTVTVVDNRARPEDVAAVPPGVRLIAANEVASSYFARNAGARLGSAPWILFLDADVEPPPDLPDQLLDPPPADDVAVVAGEVLDEEPRPGDPPSVRFAWLKRSMSQGGLRDGFAETANCAIRRAAFEALGGFREDVRSGGDADIGFRLRAAGWELELREEAAVVHRSRRTVRRLLAQQAKHGAGAGWMAREHPGSFPPRSLPGVAWWAVRRAAEGARAWRRGDRDAALVGMLDGPAVLAFELGRRLVSNRAQRR
jgi:glycosyltransferase involved in cell wall biosynthesis